MSCCSTFSISRLRTLRHTPPPTPHQNLRRLVQVAADFRNLIGLGRVLIFSNGFLNGRVSNRFLLCDGRPVAVGSWWKARMKE